MRAACLAVFATVLLAGTAMAQSAPPPGATSCTGCHGAGDLSLSGLTAAQIVEAVDAFRSGARDATLMTRIAKGFTPEETVAIAAWLTGG